MQGYQNNLDLFTLVSGSNLNQQPGMWLGTAFGIYEFHYVSCHLKPHN